MNATETARAMIDLAAKTPVEIDTVMAELDREYPARQHAITVALHAAHRAAGDRKVGDGRHAQWQMTDRQAVDALRPTDPAYVRLHDAEAAEAANREQYERLDNEWLRRGCWTRFVQVEHIHAGWDCKGGTLDRGKYRSLRHWVPELSGRDEAEAIAILQRDAHTLCTHCFPNAPVSQRQADTDECPGSGKHVDREAGAHSLRTYGKWATCPDCGARQTVTAGFNYKRHDTPAAAMRKLREKAAAQGKLVVGTGPNAEIKTVRGVELQASDPYRKAEEREPAIVALAEHRGQDVEMVREWANAKRRQRA